MLIVTNIFSISWIWDKEKKEDFNLSFCSYMKLFSVFLIHILLYEKSITIWYSVTTIRVFEYYSEITNGPKTNSTIGPQLLEYRIIRIIRCNSAQYWEFLDFLKMILLNWNLYNQLLFIGARYFVSKCRHVQSPHYQG